MKTRYGFVSNSSSSSFICNAEARCDIDVIMSKIIKASKILGITFSKDDYEIIVADKEYSDYINNWDNSCGDISDKVIIKSTSDNSIPSELFDIIERLTNSIRIHLG